MSCPRLYPFVLLPPNSLARSRLFCVEAIVYPQSSPSTPGVPFRTFCDPSARRSAARGVTVSKVAGDADRSGIAGTSASGMPMYTSSLLPIRFTNVRGLARAARRATRSCRPGVRPRGWAAGVLVSRVTCIILCEKRGDALRRIVRFRRWPRRSGCRLRLGCNAVVRWRPPCPQEHVQLSEGASFRINVDADWLETDVISVEFRLLCRPLPDTDPNASSPPGGNPAPSEEEGPQDAMKEVGSCA